MKTLKVCFEVQGLAVDEKGNPAAAGMQFAFGEVSDEKYAAFDYFEAFKNIKAIELLNTLGLGQLASGRTVADFRLISPEEYDREYGDGEGCK